MMPQAKPAKCLESRLLDSKEGNQSIEDARSVSVIAFSSRRIKRFAVVVVELWRAGGNAVGGL
jgi:hypothetical protein